MKLRHIDPVRFETSTGLIAALPPLRRGQMRQLYALEAVDPSRRETPMDASELRAARLQILFQDAVCTDAAGEVVTTKFFLEMLRADEEIDILNGMIAHHHGIDVRYAVDLQAAMRDLLKKKTAT